MDADAKDLEFKKFTEKVTENYVEYTQKLKDLNVRKIVIQPSEFLKSLEEEIHATSQETSTSALVQEASTVEDYEELFKVLDEYPSNMHKVPKKRELQRSNSSTSKNSIVDITADQSASVDSSQSDSALPLEEQRSSNEIWHDFVKFQRKQHQAKENIAAFFKIQAMYSEKIQHLHTFADQLNKIMPSEREMTNAFNASEKDQLLALANNMDELKYLSTQSVNTSSDNEMTVSGNEALRLESLIEVLNYALMQINSNNSKA